MQQGVSASLKRIRILGGSPGIISIASAGRPLAARWPPKLRSRCDSKIEQALLHFGVIKIEATEAVRRRLNQISVVIGSRPPARLVTAGVGQHLRDTQTACLGDAPGQHVLAAYSVSESRLVFDDQYPRTVSGKGDC